MIYMHFPTSVVFPSKIEYIFFGILVPQKKNLIIKTINSRVDLTDTSANTATLLPTFLTLRVWVQSIQTIIRSHWNAVSY